MDNLLSYTRILDDIKQFKRSGTRSGRDFNVLDMPSHKYFKILFYFGSHTEFDDSHIKSDSYGNEFTHNDVYGSGLLAPTWEFKQAIINTVDEITAAKERGENINNLINQFSDDLNFYNYNSAWAYLMLNNENERAEKLEQFVTLLSDISSNSPWCFESVTGIGEALERKSVDDGKFEIAPKTISIVCKPDSFDNRIGTLLSLYRDIVWSWIHKRQVIPVNLRKFDMAIYMFESPINGWNVDSIIDSNSDDKFRPSYKMVEFHNCEFKYNSIKSGYGDVNNNTGFASKYTIEITYDDAYEIAYNDIMMRKIGDVILTDLINNSKNSDAYNSVSQQDNEAQKMFLTAKNIYGENSLVSKKDDEENSLVSKKDDEEEENPLKDKNIYEKNSSAYQDYNEAQRKFLIIKNIYEDDLESQNDDEENALNDKNMYGEKKSSSMGPVADQLIGHASRMIDSAVNRAILGNLYSFSLSKLNTQIEEALQPNVIKTGMTIAQYMKNIKKSLDNKADKTPEGNIFEGSPEKETKESEGNIFKAAVISSTPTKLGNIFKNSTIANN